ncbi:MAG: SAM-dependent DNA methyltransferase, partial [Thermoanaerobaculia bacterium]|nr:SAM-dependent DNA methyltransferase [Thermoanaerobaculia bacterium]
MDAREVQVHSGLVPPSPAEREGLPSLVKKLDWVADALEIRQLALAFETGEILRTNAKAFNPDLSVDRRLLDNLTTARELLHAASSPPIETRQVDALLCRVVFACYLFDRKVIDGEYLKRAGARGAHHLRDLFRGSPERSRQQLYALFELLQRDFNGDLFAADLKAEARDIEAAHIEVLGRLLSGEELATGQISFLLYDFEVIPIETISAIYEKFLGADGEKQRREGAFYTPRFLAEVVLDLATEGVESLLDKRFLDPACGSGIFLVALFHRLAETWRRQHPRARYDTRAEALTRILRRNLFGIDSNPTACRIAAFSLYLALLDHLEPPDIRELQRRGKLLPCLVFELGEAAVREAGKTILNTRFGEADPVLPKDGFDVILGNPPWVSRGGEKTGRQEEDWPFDIDAPVAQKQVAHRFIFKAGRHLRPGGHVCFVLPSGVLLNHDSKALDFQRSWLEFYDVDVILNLADLRFQLFENAIRPALVVRYYPRETEAPARSLAREVDYVAPKTEWLTLRSNVLSVFPEDRIVIDLAQLGRQLERGEIPTTWKEKMWGMPRDWRLLDRLSSFPSLGKIAGQPHKGREKRWLIGQGFKPEKHGASQSATRPGREPIACPWPTEQPFIEGQSREISLLLLEIDCVHLGGRFPWLHRLPRKAAAIFNAPHVLVTQGMRVAFADFDVVFRHAIQGIHGPKSDRDLLQFLTTFLDSAVARYFLFHTTANWGIERAKVHLEELLRVPFPLPDQTSEPEQARSLVREAASCMKRAEAELRQPLHEDRKEIISRLRKKLLPIIYEYYDIDELEQILIEDTVNILIPSATPRPSAKRVPALEPSKQEERSQYLATLCKMLNDWANRGTYRFHAKSVVSGSTGLGVVQLDRASSHQSLPEVGQECRSGEDLEDVLARIRPVLSEHGGSLELTRNLKVF